MRFQGVKEKVRHELIEYWVNVAYLALVFGTFMAYRRLLLAAQGISYEHYGVALIEALVLGKVIMIGGFLRLGRGFESRPLIYPTLFKSFVFCVFVGAFKIVEHGVRGLLFGEGFTRGISAWWNKGIYEMLANSLVVFVSFLPFFGVKELGRVIGHETVWNLFFRGSDQRTGAAAGVGPEHR